MFPRIKTKSKFCILRFTFLTTEEISYLQLYIQLRQKLEETNALIKESGDHVCGVPKRNKENYPHEIVRVCRRVCEGYSKLTYIPRSVLSRMERCSSIYHNNKIVQYIVSTTLSQRLLLSHPRLLSRELKHQTFSTGRWQPEVKFTSYPRFPPTGSAVATLRRLCFAYFDVACKT